MEITKDETPEVKQLSDKEKALAIEKMQIDERNKRAEEQSRVQGFMGELTPLCQKWNVTLIADIQFIGAGTNMQSRLNVGVQALPSKVETPVEMVAEPVADAPAELTPTQE